MFKFPFKAQGPIIGITGSIGAGKGLVSEYLTKNNHPVINFDEVSREIRDLPEVQKKLLKEFNTTDPKEIRKIIAGDLKKSLALSQLVAVPALLETFKRTNELFKQKHPVVFWEAALLIETGTYAGLSGIILVTAKEDLRLNRAMARDQVGEELVRPILSQQMADNEKVKKLALHPRHLILENNGTIDEFKLKLLNLEPWLLQFTSPQK